MSKASTEDTKSQRREKGMGSIRKIGEGKYFGRLNVGKKPDGTRDIAYFNGKSEADVKKQIREFNLNRQKFFTNKVGTLTLEEYINKWLKLYKQAELKSSSYDRLENTIKHHIIPNIGFVQISQINSDTIQEYFNSLVQKKKILSYSSTKKIYDALNACFNYAVIKKDISANPMMLVKIPSSISNAPQKEIRIFSENEIKLIREEAQKTYSTGTPMYVYGHAYILMMNTGIRLGEATGLKWTDYNEEDETLHIQRNIQTVKKRDDKGDVTQGYEIKTDTTKTYSGNRVLHLNDNAKQAIQRLKETNFKSEYIICNSKKAIVPPAHLERTFYRILKNINIEITGLHTLRHTFASTLFLHGVDVKTVSQILGHASVAITYNTYIHLIDKQKIDAVNILDTVF